MNDDFIPRPQETSANGVRHPRMGTSVRRGAVLAALLLFFTPASDARQDFDLDLDLDDDVVIDIDATLKAAEAWARDHFDERAAEVIAGLAEPSPDKTRKAMDELQRQFAGDSILDIARVRRVAEVVLPLLEEYEETADLAPWLRTRLDYFDVADELTRPMVPPLPPGATNAAASTNATGSIAVSPEPSTNRPPVVAPLTNRPTVRINRANPGASIQRSLWQKLLSKRAVTPAAETFARELKPIFVGEGVPGELVWLAEVESSFNPEATSPVGAVGLYQLMPATARSLGLSTALPDERRQPVKAARAAAIYLKKLHRRFGDWRLALAAYNVGEGRVQRTLDKVKGRTFDDISPSLPAETQMYVPKFEAVLKRREGKSLDELMP
jgi:membrane-bound lytic murein transglycosylase D